MKNPLLVPELRQFLAENDVARLQDFCVNNHPGDVADFISALEPNEIRGILMHIEPQLRAEIFSHFNDGLQLDISETLNRRELVRLIADMSPDDRVDLIKHIPDERRERILPGLAQAEREDIRRLAAYAEGTAGAVMTSEYALLQPDLTVAAAIDKLRAEAPDKETIYYAYVVDKNRTLIGFVSLKDLILASPGKKIEDLMHREVICCRASDDQELAARLIAKYDLLALPVVNGQNVLLGIITHDDAIDVINQEHTEDMEKFMAIGGSHETGTYLQTSAWEHFKNRIGWLVALALLGLVSGYIVHRYEGLLLQFAVLATFMPMLADTGGNAGSQSATLVVRALAIGEIAFRDILRVLWKEFKVALPMAVFLAGLAYARVIFFAGNSTITMQYPLWLIGLAVSIALGLQVATATLVGALLPLAAARLKLDPAVVASPALTTLVDITGLLIFFSTAKWLLGI
jgi:magnesium transporter